jgi:hypothetical protein
VGTVVWTGETAGAAGTHADRKDKTNSVQRIRFSKGLSRRKNFPSLKIKGEEIDEIKKFD